MSLIDAGPRYSHEQISSETFQVELSNRSHESIMWPASDVLRHLLLGGGGAF